MKRKLNERIRRAGPKGSRPVQAACYIVFDFAFKKVSVLSPCFISSAILIETGNSKSQEDSEYLTNWTLS